MRYASVINVQQLSSQSNNCSTALLNTSQTAMILSISMTSVSFGDVMRAVGFHDDASIQKYFEMCNNAKCNYTKEPKGTS